MTIKDITVMTVTVMIWQLANDGQSGIYIWNILLHFCMYAGLETIKSV